MTEQIKATPIDQFPREIQYHEGLEEPTYTVKILVAQQDSYVDKKGNTWIRKK